MALLYDSFGIRDVQVFSNIWPEFDGFPPGQLARLYGHVNDDDSFPSCDLRQNFGAVFAGEHWTYDIDSSSLTLKCSSFATPTELKARVRELLGRTREFFANEKPKRRVAYFVDEVRMFGLVPEDKQRNVGVVMRTRLMQRTKQEDLELLTGLSGAGLRLIGDTDDFHWHVSVEPPHGSYVNLGLSVQLMYNPPQATPSASTDLDFIESAVGQTYDFLTENVKTFASRLVHYGAEVRAGRGRLGPVLDRPGVRRAPPPSESGAAPDPA